MSNPWDTELYVAVPALVVKPHLRVHTIQDLCSKGVAGDVAIELENVAMHAAMGRLKLYITMMQTLLDNPHLTPNEFSRQCRAADQTQSVLSTINVQRDALMKQLREAKLTCPEVPETAENARCCPVCRGTDLLTTARQTRGADEGQTIFYNCNNPKCGYEFR